MICILQLAILLVVIVAASCEQCLLSNMSWSDTMEDKEYRLKIVTVATEQTDGHLRFMRSAKIFNLDVEVYGLGEEWHGDDIEYESGGGMKIDILRKSLEKYKDDKRLILMFTDSYESIFTAGKAEIVNKFKESGASIFISAEDYCWPDRSLKTRYLIREGEGYRYLCSGGIIGYAPAVYAILTLMTVRPTDDYQLYFRHIFLDDRKKYNIKWDRRAELFQNLNGYRKHVVLKFDGPNVRVINNGYETVPVVIHGNGPSKFYLNHLANYVPKAWSHNHGCLSCKEDIVDLQGIQREKWPKVLISLFINVLTPFLESFLRHISDLDYPKDKIDVFLHNSINHHNRVVEAWIKEFEGKYKSLYYEGPTSSLTDQQSRNIGIYHCRQVKCDYYFSVDGDVTLTNTRTLQTLIEQNRPFLAPMVGHTNEFWRTNFWGDLTRDGQYARSPDFFSITNNSRRGIWNAPYVSDIYLIKSSAVKKLSITPFYSDEYDAYIQFCTHLRDKGVFMYVTNMEYFGHLKNVETYTTHHKHNDLYQIFDNILDWEDKYLHPDFTIDLERDSVDQPCQDVFSVPVVSRLFTKHLIEESEHLGKWFQDGRITGGYENVPTSPLRNIGFEKHWISMLKQYFTPMVVHLFPGYYPKSEATMNIVVKYWPTAGQYIPLYNDTSTFTVNLALNEQGVDYHGGGERYIRYDCSIHHTKVGWALIHPGRLTHQHENIKTREGTRYIMVSFVDP